MPTAGLCKILHDGFWAEKGKRIILTVGLQCCYSALSLAAVLFE